jgi:hypothetical protein
VAARPEETSTFAWVAYHGYMATEPRESLLDRLPPPASPIQAKLAVGAAAAFIIFLAVHHGGSSPQLSAPAAPATAASAIPAGPEAISPTGLGQLENASGHAIYWVGPRAGTTYELSSKGTEVFLRYLPSGTAVGDKQGFLTIGSYTVPNAMAVTRRGAAGAGPGTVRLKLSHGGFGFYTRSRPTNVYLAYPGLDYQFEVYSPDPGEALALVKGGQLQPVPVRASAQTLRYGVPTVVTPARLKALSTSLGRPIYWVGRRPGTTLELTQKGGQLVLRYLPRGVPVGSSHGELSIGTYAVPNAYAITSAAAAKHGAKPVDVGITAVGFYRPGRPTNVYLAFRGQNEQIEVYDPNAAEALRLATGGRLRPVG